MINWVKSLGLYFHTIRHLTFRQIYYQVLYRLKRIFVRSVRIRHTPVKSKALYLELSIQANRSYLGNGGFKFLNLQKIFENHIDWNFSDYRKLWVYNLNYFDFLHQEKVTDTEAVQLLDSFCLKPLQIRVGAEPYPISIRGVNWIKFFSYKKMTNSEYDAILYSHYRHLSLNLEYHILGNHLLENAFSLLFGAYYFERDAFYIKAKKLLIAELEEQILGDGAHFELSPMYHQTILYRLLDCVNLVKNNSWKNRDLLPMLEGYAHRMLSWLKSMTFSNGDVPMMNDAAFGIAPTSNELVAYAKRLGIAPAEIKPVDSGYRVVRESDVEMVMDVGNLGPDYILGHAHSDTFNFILYHRGEPLIVEAGTSTYDLGHRRDEERSTSSHNTVMVNNRNQSEVWAGFRVGRRAKIVNLEERDGFLSASHDGYGNFGITHQRTWRWGQGEISVDDELVGANADVVAVASIHFHPDQIPEVDKQVVKVGPLIIQATEDSSVTIENFNYATGFNISRKGFVARFRFKKHLGLRMMFQ